MIISSRQITSDAIEEPPLQADRVARAARFSVDLFMASARQYFPRYARLGLVLIAIYLESAAAYFAVMMTSRSAGRLGAAMVTVLFVCWITIVTPMMIGST